MPTKFQASADGLFRSSRYALARCPARLPVRRSEARTSRLSVAARAAIIVALISCLADAALGAPSGGRPALDLTTDEIVQQLVTHNQQRADRLQHYVCKRHYHLEYHGFPSSREASMDVEVAFDAPGQKNFKVTSQSGSKMLADRVFKRLLESEKEASLDPGRSALTPANYTFTLDGVESAAATTPRIGNAFTESTGAEAGAGNRVARSPGAENVYVLKVEPRGDNKYLFRGKIWVDATDFAVTRIDAEPAKNPSFWIKKTDIHHRYTKVGDYWFPEQNETETKTRLGGTANLTIDYSNYQVASVRRK